MASVSVSFFRRLLKGGSLFFCLAAVIFIMRKVEPNAEFFSSFVDNYIRSAGIQGIAIYIALTSCLVCMGVPRQVLSFAGGYAFGAWWGCLWATVGVALGCAMTFGYARYIGQSFVQRRFGKRIDRLESFLRQSPFTMALVIRCLPVGNNLVTNILAGVSRIPLLPFLAGSFVGYIPQNFIFSLLGSGVHVEPFWRTLISGVLFVLATGLGILLYRRYNHSLEE